MAFTDIPYAGSRMAGTHPFTAAAGHAAAVAKFNGGNGLIDRPTGSDLHNKKLIVMMAHRVGMTSSRRRRR